jgi:hypothetical protein
MDEFAKRLETQARWQKSRKSLSWPEKVRRAEAIRDAIKALRATKTDSSPTGSKPEPKDLTEG